MKFFDLLTLIWTNLARRKGRVALTTIGVIIGTAAVVLLVSLGVGLQQNAESQLGGIGDLTRITVYPGFSEGQRPGQPSAPGGAPGQTRAAEPAGHRHHRRDARRDRRHPPGLFPELGHHQKPAAWKAAGRSSASGEKTSASWGVEASQGDRS